MTPRHSGAAAPGGAAPGAGAPAGRRSAAVREHLAARVAAVPLGARMVALLCAVLLLGLVVTGVTAQTLLRRNLVEQVDTQLRTYAQPLLDRATGAGGRRPLGGDDPDRLPSDYYVELLDADGVTMGTPIASDTGGATPQVPRWTVEDVQRADREPVTVPATAGGGRWRAVLLPATAGGRYAFTVAIALPLTGVEQTVDRMRRVLVVTGLAVIALGSVAGRAAVRRSLRPLEEIETTAAAIAAGDLSRRVPAGPPSTEVGRLGEALNVMLGQIERAFAERAASEDRMRRFVADASHELRTPLATIRGLSELYRMGALTEPAQVTEAIRRIEDSAARLGRLVEDLLHLARLDEGRPLRAEAVDLTVLAADAVGDLHALDPGRPVRIASVPAAAELAPAVVVGDEDRLRQVLSNLTGNVVQHTPPGTPVEIAVGRSGGYVVLEVRDHGPGIAPEHAARVWERFYRVDTSRTREAGGGAGLGMAIVAAIVGAHGGSVRIAPTPGGGTTVRVELPAAAPVPVSGAPVPGTPGAGTPGDDAGATPGTAGTGPAGASGAARSAGSAGSAGGDADALGP